MSDLKQRTYYKIFTGSNQTDGLDKIHLGFEGNTSEITFKKDNTTYFHIPFFAQTQLLTNSTLIADGAISGPIPAMADRIYKKQANYGKNTPWGSTTQIKDGTWLCSWLYAIPGQQPQWLDRYYDPGRLSIDEALDLNANILDYISHDPVYYDTTSQMTLEPGVWYQYFHQGELTNQNIVSTYGGVSSDKIKLNIDDWSATPLDKSIYNNTTTIHDFQPSWVKNVYDPGYLDRNVLDFNNNSFIDCRVIYNNSYNLLNEFTISFWLYNDNWQDATGTQLVGNLSRGGYGVFYDNLKYYTYYAIPETTYGHLFLFNQNSEIYFEKNIQRQAEVNSMPIYTGMNSEFETIVVDASAQKVYKYNHLGDILAQSKIADGSFYTLPGIPKTAIIDSNNNTHVVTTSGTYTFNQDLILTETLSSQPYINNEVLVYNISGVLVREQNCLDIKFDNLNNKWSIKTDKKVYFNDSLFTYPGTSATNIAIDPENNIWILADVNDVYKYNTRTKQIINKFKVGVLSSNPDTKNITFINSYNRTTNTKKWYAIIVHSDEQTTYQVTLDGEIKTALNLSTYLDVRNPLTETENFKLLTFNCKGDYTGYEWKRIFNKTVYKNKPQIQFKVAAKQPIRGFNPTKYNLSVPVDFLVNETWYLITCTYKNGQMNLFINNALEGSKTIPGNYALTFNYKNDLFIGTPSGKIENLNTEINSKSLIWNGYFDTVRIYNYAIDYNMIQAFLREKVLAQDVIWNIPTTPIQYIETIERFFKHRLPGAKSPFFNIKLSGLSVTDPAIRLKIENEIKLAVSQIQPAYSKLLNVEWLD